jgi:hypothetical protein
MYSEIDCLILDNIVRCSYCDAKGAKCISFVTTIAAGGIPDEQSFIHHFPHHHHDYNYIDASYVCSICDKTFVIKPNNSCWCGWAQGNKRY